MADFTVVKESIFTKKEKLAFAILVAMFLFFLSRYVFWWFQPQHLPDNWNGSQLHFLDLITFGLLSFVVFIPVFVHIGSHFALWYGARPKHIEPQKNLKIAFLTCFVPDKEPIGMLRDTLSAMKDVRYPHDTWVLDEGNSTEVKKLCRQLNVKYFTRSTIAKYNQKHGKFRARTKAGNHNAWADQHAKKYEIVAQIDMDHVPQPNFFEKTLGYFKDPKVGFVGMPQFYKNTDNWTARGAAEQSFFFQGPMQQGFYGADMPFLIGTSHIYRTSAMEQIGGYAPTIVEDHLTGMNFFASKWKGVFVPEILARGEGPTNWVDYFNQQMRWSYGLFEIFFKHTPRIIHKLAWRQKINYFISQLYYFTGVAVIIGAALTFAYLVFGIRSANMNLFEMVKFSTPPFLLALTIQIYAHKFNIEPDKEPIFGPLGMFLKFGANLIYALAFLKFILGQNLRYMVTRKGSAGEMQEVPLSTFKLHLAFGALMLFALIDSFFTKHNAIQLRFWALFNIVTLSTVALSIYWKNIQAIFSHFNLSVRPVRYALSTATVLIIIVGLTFTYSQHAQTAKALFDKQFSQQYEEQISGKVLTPLQGAYLGTSVYQHNDTAYLNTLQKSIDKKFAIVGYYQSWGTKDNKFDKIWAENISANGSIPLITWEPWEPISGFDRSEYMVDQEEYRLKNITSGQYDDYIKEYAIEIKSYKKPVMIRFAHEMNGNWYPWGSTFNDPQEYVLAWRHVHEIFDGTGATNVTWVWSPNEAYYDSHVPYADQLELFYPGDDYVDWVGFSAFNWAGSYKNNFWKSPENLYGYTLSKLKKFNKPIMITETASAESSQNISLKGSWIQELAKYLKNDPDIKGVIWFNAQDNGVDWTLQSSENSLNSFKNSFGDYFLQDIPY